ncbi:hypothetical protein HY605_03405, partial [Candidatus Peregrinibacteria bacterium]|nr:hypothetical protein [Candidatus Peregrinibacteria bacterium]
MGNAYRSLEELEKAFIIYDHIAKQYPTADAAWLNRSVVLEDMERYEDALDSYKKVIANTSSFEEGYFRAGLLMMNKLNSSDQEIRAHFEEAVVATNYDTLITATYLVYLYGLGDTATLDAILAKALEKDPENPRFLEIKESYDNL